MEQKTTMLPPGVSAEEFSAAIAAFKQAVGEDHVYTSDEDVGLYQDAYDVLWGLPGQRKVSAAVAPISVEQVQKVVVAANRHRIPIYPISTGMDLGYGGSAPNLSGGVVLDLKLMNRVIEVDDKRHFAIVEPGADPNGIISADRYGLWPKEMRQVDGLWPARTRST